MTVTVELTGIFAGAPPTDIASEKAKAGTDAALKIKALAVEMIFRVSITMIFSMLI